MNLGTRLNNALAKMTLLQEASAVDYSRDHVSQGSGGHGAHGDPSRRPSGNSRPLVDVWTRRFEALIRLAEIDAGLRPAEQATPRQHKRSELRGHMREYEGYDPVDVAFYERVSTELVRSVRKDMGLNMVTGERMESRERPLTAPTRDSLKLLQDTVGGEL
jgi:hypothetical protein